MNCHHSGCINQAAYVVPVAPKADDPSRYQLAHYCNEHGPLPLLKLYRNPHCGCPHPEEEHTSCAQGLYCSHSNCRCVDGTYYGEMSDPQSLQRKIMSLFVESRRGLEPIALWAAERVWKQSTQEERDDIIVNATQGTGIDHIPFHGKWEELPDCIQLDIVQFLQTCVRVSAVVKRSGA